MRSGMPRIGLAEFVFGMIVEGILYLLGLLGLEWSRNSRLRTAVFLGVLGIPIGSLLAYFGLHLFARDIAQQEILKSFIGLGLGLLGIALIAMPMIIYFFAPQQEQK